MSTIDIMIDLETLGIVPGSVVLSIGAASSVLLPTGLGADDFIGKIDMRDSLYAGLIADPSTLAWWRSQSKAAWEAATTNGDPLVGTLETFSEWLAALRSGSAEQTTGNKLRLWGDASSFDLVLLACAYRAAKLPVPWSYQEEFDYRTLRTLLNSEKPRSKVQHDALSDARAQLVHLQDLLNVLGLAVPK
jgi:hypothetical protein